MPDQPSPLAKMFMTDPGSPAAAEAGLAEALTKAPSPLPQRTREQALRDLASWLGEPVTKAQALLKSRSKLLLVARPMFPELFPGRRPPRVKGAKLRFVAEILRDELREGGKLLACYGRVHQKLRRAIDSGQGGPYRAAPSPSALVSYCRDIRRFFKGTPPAEWDLDALNNLPRELVRQRAKGSKTV